MITLGIHAVKSVDFDESTLDVQDRQVHLVEINILDVDGGTFKITCFMAPEGNQDDA